ncbi:MAG TPA: N-6 DNA methylase, partial [Niastella sp.]
RLDIVTPKELSRIMVDLLNDNNNTSLYDPYCRSGDLLSSAAREMGKLNKIHGLSTGRLPWKLSKLRLLLLDLPAKIEIDKGFERPYLVNTAKFDTIISNPPFGSYGQDPYYQPSLVEGPWSWFASKSNRSEIIYLCHVLDHLSDKGRAAVIVPTIFLSGQGGIKELRKQIIQQNILDAVITLPPGIFSQTGVFTAILIFNKDRKQDKVFMLDAAKLAVKDGKQVYLEETKVNQFILQFKEQQYSSNEHTRVLTIAEIEGHDHDLQFSVYDISDDLFIEKLIPAAEILDECKHLEDELEQVRVRIATLLESRQHSVS